MTTVEQPLILIVDDDYDFLEINRMILERAGYRVVTAAEPQQALTKMAKEKPDLVISDLMMTSLDSGFSFARSHQRGPAIRGRPGDPLHLGLQRHGPRLPARARPRRPRR